ncbi:MAG: biotin/lipoyl-binding protein, partial [Candidatus Omnitrophica bacterium]|nr:biotin/lipoyl-binding protein [Candidatus Omnitrophota bacterium]
MSLPKTKVKKLMIFIAVGILAVIMGGRYVINSFNVVETDDAYIEGRIYLISPKIPGTVKVVRIEDNQKVKKGDLLIEIDPMDYELKVNEVQAGLDMRKALFNQASR